MTGDILRHLQVAAMLKVVGDARRPKTVTAEIATDACRKQSPSYHRVGVGSQERAFGQLQFLAFSPDAAKEGRVLRLGNPSRCEISVQVFFEEMVAGDSANRSCGGEQVIVKFPLPV